MLLTQHAERAEAALEEVSTELNSLEGQVSQMVAAISGKPSVFNLMYFLLNQNINRQLTLCIKHAQAHEAKTRAKIP